MDSPASSTTLYTSSSLAISQSSGYSSPLELIDDARKIDAESAALASAILARDVERVRLLLDLKIVLTMPQSWVLFDACLGGLELLRLLLFSSDMDFNIPISYDGGDSILHFVLRTPRDRFRDDKRDVVELLLRTGLNPLQRDRLGDTALHLLAQDTTEGYILLQLFLEGCPEVREPCLEHINSKNVYEDTPLLVAVLYNNIECVQLLLNHGADPAEINEDGMTALDLAREKESLEITELLLASMNEKKQGDSEMADSGGFARCEH